MPTPIVVSVLVPMVADVPVVGAVVAMTVV
jgi:hypothetical protein